MDSILYGLGIIIGAYMIWGGATKSEKKPYYWLYRRSALLFKSGAHIFLAFSGGAVVGVMLYYLTLGAN
jgi:hypothetical protein